MESHWKERQNLPNVIDLWRLHYLLTHPMCPNSLTTFFNTASQSDALVTSQPSARLGFPVVLQVPWRVPEWYQCWDPSTLQLHRNHLKAEPGCCSPSSPPAPVMITTLPSSRNRFCVLSFGVSSIIVLFIPYWECRVVIKNSTKRKSSSVSISTALSCGIRHIFIFEWDQCSYRQRASRRVDRRRERARKPVAHPVDV